MEDFEVAPHFERRVLTNPQRVHYRAFAPPQRPDLDVRIAAPGAAEGELAAVSGRSCSSTPTPMGSEAVARVPCCASVLYSDGTDVRISARGEVSETRDMPTADLLRVVDGTTVLAGLETGRS